MFAAIIMLITAAVFSVIGLLIFNGNKRLIHSYHCENVSDEKSYCRAFGKCVLAVGASALVSGITLLFAHNAVLPTLLGFGVFFIGFAFAAVLFVRVQKKYNGGVI